jgi:hypothetical protein
MSRCQVTTYNSRWQANRIEDILVQTDNERRENRMAYNRNDNRAMYGAFDKPKDQW